MLTVDNLGVGANGEDILTGLDFQAEKGGLYVIMGPNGSGKSTFSKTLAGHPDYDDYDGSIKLNDREVSALSPGDRLEEGLMLGFQHPPKIEGVRIRRFLNDVLEKQDGYENPEAREEAISFAAEALGFSEAELDRGINDGFSGGERKRLELMQARLIEPDYLILDEPDSGIDVDSLDLISEQINYLHGRGTSIILITHYGDTLSNLKLNEVEVNVFKDGKIVKSGGSSLAEEIEEKGFNRIYEECGCN